MGIALVMAFGILMMLGPAIAEALGAGLSPAVSAILMIVGLALSISCGFLLILTKLYRKTKADEAFVRTGMGGQKVVLGGGAVTIPFLHEVIPVPLNVFKLEVKRNNDKAVLRNVAATKTLNDLNTKRDEFVKEVSEQVAQDLLPNGLTLETATISTLDQTDIQFLKETNVFDAKGMKTATEIIEQNKTARNVLERRNEQARKQQDVETRKQILELDQAEKEAEAAQRAEVLKIQAEREREAREKQIEAERDVDLAMVAKAQATEVARKQQEKAVQVEAQRKQQAIEVAERNKLAAIAEAERDKAVKETEKANAERERQEALENIKTVEVVQAARRKKEETVLQAQATAEQQYVRDQREADAKAYSVKKDAEARKEAAEADALAITKKAEAERDAQVAQAAGKKAVEMVPVEVQKEAVAVDKRRMEEVTIPELKAREDFGRSQQEFELAQARIEASKYVEIERAKASIKIFEKVDVKAYTTLEQVENVTKNVMRGQNISELANSLVDGLKEGTTQEATDFLTGIVSQLGLGNKATVETQATGTDIKTSSPAVPTPTRTSEKAAKKSNK